ncbi:uncharacterized protein LOC143595322 [Bidens hawaiensis]|uniref:uncharacterized protein LOC143595322 n=1 Tax=Bidens hawaiensis TaxID=980011 RepID=UPI004049D131
MFKSLILLALVEVPISDKVIKCLTTNCPLLQVFTISNCHGFKRFCVCGHQNLQRVRIFYTTPGERIDIEAPNLYDLLVSNWARREAPTMNLVSCQKLTKLTYYCHSLPNSNDLNEFLSNFPLVENLVLVTTSKCYNFKLSSHTLRTLVLHSNHQFDLADIEFNTHNLGLFIYSCNASNHRPLITRARLLQACMQSYPNGQIIEAVWFRKLRQFLDNGSGFKVLNFYFHTRKFTELEKLKAVELPPYEVNHVELSLDNHEDHAAFVDAVLRCCRPQSLTLRSPSPLTDFEEQSGVVKFTYEKLLQQEDEGRTNIQIVSPCSSLLMSLSGEGRAISFMKEEVTHCAI